MKPATFAERFWARVDTSGDCWEWTKARRDGYGILRKPGVVSPARAHRVAWELTHGPIPEGMWVLHKCDNPPCVNPDHLYLGTVKENVRDMIERGRWDPAVVSQRMVEYKKAQQAERTHCRQGHEFTPENTYFAPSHPTARVCRACGRAHAKSYRDRSKAYR